MNKASHKHSRELFCITLSNGEGSQIEQQLFAADSTSLRHKVRKWYPGFKIVDMNTVAP